MLLSATPFCAWSSVFSFFFLIFFIWSDSWSTIRFLLFRCMIGLVQLAFICLVTNNRLCLLFWLAIIVAFFYLVGKFDLLVFIREKLGKLMYSFLSICFFCFWPFLVLGIKCHVEILSDVFFLFCTMSNTSLHQPILPDKHFTESPSQTTEIQTLHK